MVDSSAQLIALDVMSRDVVRVDADRPLWEAWLLMAHHGIHHLAVTSGHRFLGIVNEVRLLEMWTPGPWEPMSQPVRLLLRARPTCASPECSLGQVASVMRSEGVDAVAIVDRDMQLVGLVTAADILRTVSQVGLHAVCNPVASDS